MLYRRDIQFFDRCLHRLLLICCLVVLGVSADSAAQDNSSALTGPYLGQKPPGDEPKIFAEGIVSVGREHSAPAFSPAGNEVFWCTMRNDDKIEIYHMKVENGIWSEPDKFCKGFNPFFSVDGKQLYYIAKGFLGSRNLKIRKKSGSEWSGADNTGSPLNSKKMMWNASVAANRTLYFTLFNEQHQYDIYKSEFSNEEYADAEALGEEINRSGASGPFIAPDESYLIFQSGRPGGSGGDDLYICYQESDGNWTDPVNLGNRINTNRHEYYPRVSPDGRYLFFVRACSILWVSTNFIEELGPAGD